MSKERTMDTRMDPTTLVAHPVALSESYKIMAVPGLPGRYGFALCEAPRPREAGQSYVRMSYTTAGGGQQVMEEADISTDNLQLNQFCVNYSDAAGERPFRAAQVFVNKALENLEALVVYEGLGDCVHAGASFPPPVGGTYTQYPGLSAPAELFSGTVWRPYHEIFPQYAGVFARLPGGHASAFDAAGTAAPQAQTTGGGSHYHSVTMAKVATVGASFDVVTGVGNPAGGNSMSSGENRPKNMSVLLWVRLH